MQFILYSGSNSECSYKMLRKVESDSQLLKGNYKDVSTILPAAFSQQACKKFDLTLTFFVSEQYMS